MGTPEEPSPDTRSSSTLTPSRPGLSPESPLEESTSGTPSSPARPLLPGLTPSPSDLDTLDARGTGARTEENASTSRPASSLPASAQLAEAVPTAKSKCCINLPFDFPVLLQLPRHLFIYILYLLIKYPV